MSGWWPPCGFSTLSPPRSLRTRGLVEQSLPRCWALLLLPQLPQQLPPPYGACRSGSVFVVYPSSLRVVQLGVGLTMMHNARAKQLEGQCDQFRKDGLDGLGLAGLAGSGPRARTERSEKGEKEEH